MFESIFSPSFLASENTDIVGFESLKTSKSCKKSGNDENESEEYIDDLQDLQIV